MNKFQKLLQCLKYRKVILGVVGRNNRFEKGTRIESVSKIGSYNYFSFRVMIGNAIIGNYCSFGPDVKIGQSQHSINYYTTYQKISKKCINHSMIRQPAIIENDVWIGANTVVMQGVKIGNGAVIGANAVVTRDVPEYAIAVGVPAKVIKYRLDEKTRKMLLEKEWWKYDFEQACSFFNQLDKNN